MAARTRKAGRSAPAQARAPKPALDSPETPEERKLATRAAWVAIALLAACVLFIALGPHRIGAFDVESDFYGGYAPAAISIQQGRILAADGKLPAVFGFVGPLYPALLALGGFALGDMFTAAELLSVAACVLTVVFWFLTLRRRANATLGLFTTLLLASNPSLVRYGYAAVTDTTAIAFQAAAIYLLFARTGRRSAVLAGVCAALAALTRYTSVYLVPAGLIAIAAGSTARLRRRDAAVLFTVSFFALTLPWQIYARLHGAEIQFHQLFAYEVYAKDRGVSWDAFLANIWPRFEHAPLAVLTTEPRPVMERLLFNLFDHAREDARDLLGGMSAALAAIALLTAGIAAMLRRSHLLRGIGSLVLLGAWAYLAMVPAPSSDRYSLAVLPFYLMLAGATLAWALRRATRSGHRLVTALVLAGSGATVGMSVYTSVGRQSKVLEAQPLEVVEIAQALRKLARPGDRVMARKPNLAFHAGVGSAYYQLADNPEMLGSEARAQHVRWLYVSVAEVMLRPMSSYLLDTTAAVPGLTLRAWASVPTTVDGAPWHRDAALYEIGPEFGVPPAWFASDTLWMLHLLRGRAALPDANNLLKLARLELAIGNPSGFRAAWRAAAQVDPEETARMLARFRGDTVASVLALPPLVRPSGAAW